MGNKLCTNEKYSENLHSFVFLPFRKRKPGPFVVVLFISKSHHDFLKIRHKKDFYLLLPIGRRKSPAQKREFLLAEVINCSKIKSARSRVVADVI